MGHIDNQSQVPSQWKSRINLFKVSNRNTTKRGEICSELTLKTPEQRQ